MKELLEIVRVRRAHPDVPFALATVVWVEGSSYRKVGARMLVSLQGRIAGSVSGGCLEKDVISKALSVILQGTTDLAVYDTTDQDDMAFGSSLGCEGRIAILIQPVPAGASWPLAEQVDRAVRTRHPIALATVYRAAKEFKPLLGQSFCPETVPTEWASALGPGFDAVLVNRKPLHRQLGQGSLDLVIERIAPPTRVVIFGGGDDVPPLVRLAKEVGYHVTVMDRRIDFADPSRFPGADLVQQVKPREVAALGLLKVDDVAVIMNHHYETDAELLGLLIRMPLAYLGMLGPRRRTVKILNELREQGISITAEDLDKLHAPVGLDLGSETPEQIALCILAELHAVISGRSGVHLRGAASLVDEVLGAHAKLASA